MLDIHEIRRQFPILRQTVESRPLIYLDSAATAQKPITVLDAMTSFYKTENANAHRSMHVLAERATVAYENARGAVRRFIGASRSEEIIFTRNCTEAINLVARTWGNSLEAGDTIVLSILEHHSNIVPWLQLKEERDINIEWIDIDDDGNLRLDQLDEFLKRGTVKLVAITAQSNVLGVRPPLEIIIEKAHIAGALVLVDAAQAIAHNPICVSPPPVYPESNRMAGEGLGMGADFLAFSGHKLYGPTGIGVLYGKYELLESLPPFLGGGQMIHEVHTDHFTPADIPARFEAGTQPIAEAVGLHAAIDWIAQFDWKDIGKHEQNLLALAAEELRNINSLRILGSSNKPTSQQANNSTKNAGCMSFVIEGIHPHDLTEILGRQGICLRAGHHCAQPLHRRLGITASTRLSVDIYNTEEEIKAIKPAVLEAMNRLR